MGTALSILAWTVGPYIGTKLLDALFGDSIPQEELAKIKFASEQAAAEDEAKRTYVKEEGQKQASMESLLLQRAMQQGKQAASDRTMDFQREHAGIASTQDALSTMAQSHSVLGGDMNRFQSMLKQKVNMGDITGIR